MAEQLKAPERENRKPQQANAILCNAAAYVAMADLDRGSQ